MRHASDITRNEDRVTGDFALHPSRQHRARKIGRCEKIKAGNSLELGFRRGSERTQAAAARMAEDRVRARKFVESGIHESFELGPLGQCRPEDIRGKKNPPRIWSLFGHVS